MGCFGVRINSQSERRIDRSQVSAFRLARHHLADHKQVDLVTICRDVGGVQAQVMSSAQMALWARMHGVTRAEIHAALWKDRSLVKTSCMRSTLHLLPADDLPIYISALKRSRLHQMRRVMMKYGAVTPAAADAVMEAAVKALRAGPMTRRELTAHILSLGFARGKAKKWFELGWWGVVRQAIVEGHICYGPDRGQEVTFIRVDQWLPKQKKVAEAEAKQILLRRYLRTYGPATPQDFARWTGMTMEEVRAVWTALSEELAEVFVGDKEAAILREDLKKLRDQKPGKPLLRLLPNFDSYLLGHVAKDHLVADDFYSRVYRKAGWISPVVLLDGRVIGTWSHARGSKGLTFEVKLFQKLNGAIRGQIEEEAASLGKFLDAPWKIKMTR